MAQKNVRTYYREMRQWGPHDAFYNTICADIFYICAQINDMRAKIARKGADMANRMDWIPSQEEKLLELMSIWQTKLVGTPLQNAYEWPADE